MPHEDKDAKTIDNDTINLLNLIQKNDRYFENNYQTLIQHYQGSACHKRKIIVGNRTVQFILAVRRTGWGYLAQVVGAWFLCLLVLTMVGVVGYNAFFSKKNSPPASSTSANTSLDSDRLAEIAKTITELKQKVGELTEKGVPLPPNFATDVANSVKVPPPQPFGDFTPEQLEKVRKFFLESLRRDGANAPTPAAPVLSPDEKQKLVAALLAAAKSSGPQLSPEERKKWLDDLLAAAKSSGPQLSPDEKKQLLTTLLATARSWAPQLSPDEKKQLLGALLAAEKAAHPKEIGTVERDVYLVISHTNNLNANRYSQAISNAINSTVQRKKDAALRVGVLSGSGGELSLAADVDDKIVNAQGLEAAFGEKSRGTSESAQLWGTKIKPLIPTHRPICRGILIVTIDSEPLLPTVMGWSDLMDVHVILIARDDLTPTQALNLASWYKFAEARKGTVYLLGKNSDEKQRDLLEQQIRRLILLPMLPS